MREIANRQRSAADRRAPRIGVVGGQDRGACEDIDSTAAADRRCKHIIGGCVIEVDRAGSSAKCDARRNERAGGSRRIAHARADVECSHRASVRRDRNGGRDDIAAVRNCERAGARVANPNSRNVAPKGARAGHRHGTVRACTVADVADEGGDIDDPSAIRDCECARAKTADVEPAAWSVGPGRARPDHRHRASRAERQSDRAAATAHAVLSRAAVLNCKRARAPTTDHDASGTRPAGARTSHRHRALSAQ